MVNALSQNMRKGFQPLRGHDPDRVTHGEVIRDQVLTEIEARIQRLRAEGQETAAVEMEQQMKLLRLRNRGTWWTMRAGWSCLAILRSA